ncbi:transporter [Sporolactobacillus kofuensis]|uniref:Transporter n=1 Tax=Sporolactobacillus kofuensis TaxID=269672 RepID=A0ABW1WF85_9BACL|nr:transporter [Sporolactobacillus kofuensis]MCO7176412.1 transporter [Sporolactobacillus kofuensis]
MRKKLIGILQVAATFIGTVIGAGFASGREILQFFTQYQAFGTIGSLLSGALIAWIGTKMMLYARRIDAYSFNDLTSALFGDRIGALIQSLLFFIIFGITGVMLAGSGAVFQEQLGWERQIGILVAVLISFMFLLKGVRGLLFVNSLVVPLMIGFVLMTFWANRAGVPYFTKSGPVSWFIPAINYAAFNLSTALVVLVPLAKEFKDEQVLKYGGWLGGAGLGLLLFLSHLMMVGKSDLFFYELPMAELVRPLGETMRLAFIAVIFGEILTTFVGNIFGLSRQLHSVVPKILTVRKSMILLTIGAFMIAQIGYGALVATLYPLYGALCAFIFIYMCWVRLPQKNA